METTTTTTTATATKTEAETTTETGFGGQLVEEGEALRRLVELAPGRAEREHFDVVVIGGGQAGLSVGYQLARLGLRFVILDGSARVGDTWRKRWDSLRLFSNARLSALEGLRFPGPQHHFPTKDQMADYLESYAAHFRLPVRNGARVQTLTRADSGRYLVKAGALEIEADQVVVAMANYQVPRFPAFAAGLRPGIVQLHSKDYRNPGQLQPGPVLIVGGGNSGADIAMDLVPDHRVWLAGRNVGQVPFNIEGIWARLFLIKLVMRFLFHRVLTIKTPMGRKARPVITSRGGPLVRLKAKQLARAGVVRVPRVTGVRDGLPVLEDGRVLEVANVIWAGGFEPGFASWIDLPIFAGGEHGEPVHRAGIVEQSPGLYFVGLHFLYSLSSSMIHGVGRDAARIAAAVAARHARNHDLASDRRQAMLGA
jgi:putative flavoprotein involved in K+ transport